MAALEYCYGNAIMATATAVSIDEYLHTSYSPDCDFIDGDLQERNVGELDHSDVQFALAQWFKSHDAEWNTRTCIELRLRGTPSRFRVADVCFFRRGETLEQVPQRPPLAVIEVLSPEDRFSLYQQRFEDYRNMGVRHIWVVDPQTRRGFDCSAGSWIETQSFAIEDSPIRVDLAIIFSQLS